ncbi:MAG: D-alanine--D-alanine ligase family protein [Butyricicoccaceae bacterium]
MSKINLIVLFGGVSTEHDVSCVSAASILRNCSKEKYNIYPVGITNDGRWFYFESDQYDLVESGAWEQSDCLSPAVISPDRATHGLLVIRENGVETIHADCVFPVLHGINGEDGTMQGLMELAHIPYCGPGVAASANSMDKSLTKQLISRTDVRQAAYYLAQRHEFLENPEQIAQEAESEVGRYPLFVKPCSTGSSVGVYKVTDTASLIEGLRAAFQYDEKVLVEEFIDGREIEVAVLGNEDPVASVAGEIAPEQEFYSYDAKYVDNTTALYIPARIDEEAMAKVREAAVTVYRTLGCKGLSRVDFFCTHRSGEIVFNEINTLPGFTSISMYPKLFGHCGIPYSELIDRIIALAMERYHD